MAEPSEKFSYKLEFNKSANLIIVWDIVAKELGGKHWLCSTPNDNNVSWYVIFNHSNDNLEQIFLDKYADMVYDIRKIPYRDTTIPDIWDILADLKNKIDNNNDDSD